MPAHPESAEPPDVVASSVEHGNDGGLCAICGSAWPCPRADLDGRDLAALCARLDAHLRPATPNARTRDQDRR